MKKFSVILSLLAVSAMILAACSAASTPTPAVTTAPTKTLSSGLPGTGATKTPAATAAGTKTDATSEATKTVGTPQATRPAGTQQAGGTAGIPSTGRLQNDYRLMSVLLTFRVVDSKNQPIGDVQDMILNVCNARIDYLVITPDESLGFQAGSALVIPFSAVNTDIPGVAGATQGTGTPAPSGTPAATQQATGTPAATATTGTGGLAGTGNQSGASGTQPGALVSRIPGVSSRTFILRENVSAEVIKKAPVILGSLNILKADWDKDIRTYWSSELKQNITTECQVPGLATTGTIVSGTQTAGATAQPTLTVTGTITATAEPTQAATPQTPVGQGTATPTGQGDNGMVAVSKIVFATRMRITEVVDGNNNVIGNVVDAVFNESLGRLDYVIINPNTSLNMTKPGLVAVPAGAFNVEYKNNDWRQPVIVLLVDVNVLAGAPVLTGTVNVGNAGWDTEITTYWQSNIPNSIPENMNNGGATATATP